MTVAITDRQTIVAQITGCNRSIDLSGANRKVDQVVESCQPFLVSRQVVSIFDARETDGVKWAELETVVGAGGTLAN